MHPALVLALGAAFSVAPTAAAVTHKHAFSGGYCSAFCVSADGKRLAMDCWTVWDVPARKPLFSGRTRGAHGMAFSPDGKFLAVAGDYSEFFVYHAADGKLHWDLTLEGHGDTILQHVEFTADSRLMVSSSCNGMLRVWDVRVKKPVALFCFPVEGMHEQAGQDEYLRAWRTLAGKKSPPGGVETFVAHKTRLERLDQFAISPDGKTLALPTGHADVLLIELSTGKVVKRLETTQNCTFSVRFSPDGKRLAVGGGASDDEPWLGTLELWDVVGGKRIRGWKGHHHTVLKMAFSPDGNILATGGVTDGVRVWEVSTGKQLYRLHERNNRSKDSRILGVAFLPDGKALLTLPWGRLDDEAGVHFWVPATGKRIPQPLGK